MRFVLRLKATLFNLLRRPEAEAQLDDELRTYLDLLTADYVNKGLASEAAKRAALLELGGVEPLKEATRDAWSGDIVAVAARELRQTVRSLARAPVYVAIAVLTLGIAIGSATALFTIVKGSLLRPLPAVADPDRLVSIEPAQGSTMLYDVSYPDFLDLRAQVTTLTGVAAYDGTPMVLRNSAGTDRTSVSWVSGDFFAVLGVRPEAGRLLVPADVVVDDPRAVAVIGYDLWQTRFGGSPSAVGARITLDGYPLTVVGVAPKGFVGAMALHEMAVWIPLTMLNPIMRSKSDLGSRLERMGRVVGRLAPGKTAVDAEREVSLIAARLAATYAEDKGRTMHVYAGAGMTVEEREEEKRMPQLLASAVAVLLLIACANVANLSLVRAAARRRELATRLALGASRASLVGRLVLESAIVALGAAMVGLGLAQLFVRWESAVGTITSMAELDLTLDWRVLGVAIASCTTTVLFVSIAPAMQTWRVPAGAVLKDGGGGAVRRSAGQRALVVLQVAASLVLLLSAAVVFGAVRRSLANDLGFDPRPVTTAYLDPHDIGLDSAGQMAYYRDVLTRASAEPSVSAASIMSTVPPAPWDQPAVVFRSGDEPTVGQSIELANGPQFRAYVDDIYPGAFAALGIPLLLGRDVRSTDDDRVAHVAIVSKRLSDALWPNENPLGKVLFRWSSRELRRGPVRVVGVVGDTRHAGISSDLAPVLYVPYAQWPDSWSLTLVLRGRGGASLADTVVRRIVDENASSTAMRRSSRQLDRIHSQVEPQRRAGTWIVVFGGIALLLSALGLYGIVAQSVIQRTRELAVRVAIGASPTTLLQLVLGEGARLAAVGVIAGIAGAAAFIRVLQSMFTGLDYVDLRACAVAIATLSVAMLAASYIPARRAVRLDVMDALRTD